MFMETTAIPVVCINLSFRSIWWFWSDGMKLLPALLLLNCVIWKVTS